MIEEILTYIGSVPQNTLLLIGCGLVVLIGFFLLELRTSRWRQKCHALTIANSRLEERLQLAQEHGKEKSELLRNAREEMQLQFKTLAQDIFEEKSRRLTDQNNEKLDTMLQPFREQIRSFRNRVDAIFLEETRERSSLKTEIMHLRELNQQINTEAKNLTEAITGNNKLQGTWGEMVLERLLEQSGLRKGHEYDTQVGLRDSRNRLLKPDVIVHLPEQRDIVIDSKVSLSAWSRYINSDDEAERERAMAEHLQSIRNHLTELCKKDYSSLKTINSLEFVLMFIPIDAAFITAMQHQDRLMSDMYSRRIIIVTPTTLLVTLKTVEHIWQLEKQNRNALEIAGKAGLLYDKFCGFLEDMEKLGRQLDISRESYDRAVNKLSRGRGNLVSQARNFPGLGVQTKKEIPKSFLEETDPELLPEYANEP